MSDNDNYSWLDDHASDPSAPGDSSTSNSAPPPRSADAAPPVHTADPAALPPMSGQRRIGGSDPLAEKLLAEQPRRQRGRGRFGTRDKLKLGAIVLVIAAAVVYANFIGPDTSSIGGLDVGECFETPGTSAKRVTMQDCALPHQGQVVAEANGLRADSQEKCAEAFDALDPTRLATLPADASFRVLNATISHRCVVISPSGQITQPLTDP